jgi:hypothetical protein
MSALTWGQAITWRLRRHSLDPIGEASVEDVVRRLGAVQAQHDAATELSIRTRQQTSEPGDVSRALADGRLIKSFAFRGATHLMTPEDAGVWLALRASSRMWELPSWRDAYGLEPDDWPAFREAVADALRDGPLTRAELGAAVTSAPSLADIAFGFTQPSWTLMKALAWQGVVSFGPERDGQPTFQRLDGNSRWAGIPDLADAGPRAVASYLGAYGPANATNLEYWLGAGLGAGGKRIEGWIEALGDRVSTVDVEGEPFLMLREDVDEAAGSTPTASVRLLPAYDQWVLGPGTADPHVVPPARRALVSRGAAVAIIGGVVSGTWSLRRGRVEIAWFPEAATPDEAEVERERERIRTLAIA